MSEPFSSRVPHDLAAEKAVLGGIIGDNQVFDEVSKLLEPSDFHLPAHQAIYEAMERLQKSSPAVPIDQLTLTSELRKQGKLNQSGGATYLAELESYVPTTVNTRSYAEIVREHAVKRRMIESSRELIEMAAEPSTDAATLIDEAQRRMFGLAEKTRDADLRPFPEVLDRTLELIEQLRAAGGSGGVTGLASGFGDLDRMLTGFHEGELIIIAARPGCGKTSFVLNAAAHAAVRENKAVAIFSLEMPEDQLAIRLLSAESRIDMKRIREGRLGAAQMEQLSHTAAQLYNAPIFIDDSGSLSSFDLRTKARRLQTMLNNMDEPKSLGLIVIDYLQLMSQRGKVESRQQEVQEISRSLKSLAKELKVPIIALSQLNRKVEERRGKGSRPMLSDLRESGAIEQDADVVMFLHREQADDEGDGGPRPSGPVEVELVVAKQRNGPTGEVPLLFFGEFTRFESRAREAA